MDIQGDLTEVRALAASGSFGLITSLFMNKLHRSIYDLYIRVVVTVLKGNKAAQWA